MPENLNHYRTALYLSIVVALTNCIRGPLPRAWLPGLSFLRLARAFCVWWRRKSGGD